MNKYLRYSEATFLAISYRRTTSSRWGDSFWIVPGTLILD